jgi:hypothetical protein
MSQDIEVEANYINKKQFSYTCPFCFCKYKMDGNPYKNAKNKDHYHGSGGELHNRTERRAPHCDNGKFPKQYSEFKIHITDRTVRN